jgi:hypothetical protein
VPPPHPPPYARRDICPPPPQLIDIGIRAESCCSHARARALPVTHCRNFPIRDSDRAPNKFFLAAVFLVRPKYTRFAGSSELERPLTVCSALLLLAAQALPRVFALHRRCAAVTSRALPRAGSQRPVDAGKPAGRRHQEILTLKPSQPQHRRESRMRGHWTRQSPVPLLSTPLHILSSTLPLLYLSVWTTSSRLAICHMASSSRRNRASSSSLPPSRASSSSLSPASNSSSSNNNSSRRSTLLSSSLA